MTNDARQAALEARARRWTSADLRGYPALSDEQQTEVPFAAVLDKPAEKKPKQQEARA